METREMQSTASTADLVPDPLEVSDHIRQLNRELSLARRLLRLALTAKKQQTERASSAPASGEKLEVAHA